MALFGALTMLMVFSGHQREASSLLFCSVKRLGFESRSTVPLALFSCAAASLGIAVECLRLVVSAAVLATATLVALVGVIGFVDLMVPHLSRSLAELRHGPLTITAALVGATLLLGGDLANRTVLVPLESPVGIVSAIAGFFVLTLLWRESE